MNKDIDSYILEAQENFNSQNYEKALENSLNAIKIDKDHKNAHLFAGLSYFELDNMEKTIEHLGKCESELEKFPDIWEKYPIALVDVGEIKEALEVFRKIIAKYPNHTNGYYNYAYTLTDSRIAEYEKAIEYYDIAESKHYNLPTLYFCRAICYHNINDYFNAIRDLDKLFEIMPEHSEGAVLMGDVYTKLGEYETGINYYSRALYYVPTHKKAIYKRLINRIQLKDKKGNIINREAAQKDADILLNFVDEFFTQEDKDGNILIIKKIEIAKNGGLIFRVSRLDEDLGK